MNSITEKRQSNLENGKPRNAKINHVIFITAENKMRCMNSRIEKLLTDLDPVFFSRTVSKYTQSIAQ